LHTSSFFTADAVFTSFEQVRLSRHSRKSVSRGAVISKLHYRSLALQPVDLFALLTDRTQLSLCPQGLLLPGFHQDGHPNLMLDIATVPTGQFTRTGLPPVGLAASFAALKLLLPPRQSRGFSPSNRPSATTGNFAIRSFERARLQSCRNLLKINLGFTGCGKTLVQPLF
jgi:hypothetical protein